MGQGCPTWWCRALQALRGGASVPKTMTTSRAPCQAPRRSKQAMALGRGAGSLEHLLKCYHHTEGRVSVHGLFCQLCPLEPGSSAVVKKKCSQESKPQDGASEGSDQDRAAFSLPLNSTKGTGPPQWPFWSLSGGVPHGPSYDVAFQETEKQRSHVHSPFCRRGHQVPEKGRDQPKDQQSPADLGLDPGLSPTHWSFIVSSP